jgi:N,N'-diacetylchitobiose transport system substrate-binding protein
MKGVIKEMMRTGLKWWLVALLSAVLALSACTAEETADEGESDQETNAGENAEETNEGGENAEETEGNGEDAAEAGSDESGELRVWIMETGSPEEAQAYFDRINEQFQELYPNVTVDVQFIPWLSAHQNMITAMAGGNAPDVAEMGTTWNPEFAAMGALHRMDGAAAEWGLSEEWVPALEEVGTYEETLYGVPWYAGLRQLVYNKEIFEEAGVEPPQTYDELWEVSETIIGETDAYAFPAVGISQHFILPMVWHFGGELAVQEENDEGEMVWVSQMNAEPAIEAFTFYTDMYKEGFVPDGAVNWSVLDTRQAFAQEDLAMTIDVAPGINAIISENPDIEDKIGVAPLPAAENNASFVGGSNLTVFEQSPNKELAEAYVGLLVEEENITEWAEFTGFFPGTLEGLEDPAFTEDERLNIFAEALVEGRTYPPSPSWGRFEGENLFVAPVQEVMLGDKSVEEALAEVAESMNKAFETE